MRKYSVIALVCLLTVVTFLFSACASKSFELEDITKIEITNGSTGETAEVTEAEDIQSITQMFIDASFKKGSSSADSTGWSYRVRFYQGDKLAADITVLGEVRISHNGYFYDIEGGTIDTGYLAEIIDAARNQ